MGMTASHSTSDRLFGRRRIYPTDLGPGMKLGRATAVCDVGYHAGGEQIYGRTAERDRDRERQTDRQSRLRSCDLMANLYRPGASLQRNIARNLSLRVGKRN